MEHQIHAHGTQRMVLSVLFPVIVLPGSGIAFAHASVCGSAAGKLNAGGETAGAEPEWNVRRRAANGSAARMRSTHVIRPR
jgi:hypothetical protein